MRLLFYSTGPSRQMQWLYERLAKLWPVKTEFCLNVNSLGNCLRRSGGETTLAVLLTASQEELQGVMSLRSLLTDIPHVLILPDSKRETIAKGHVLAPRFLTDAQCNFMDLYRILNKMLNKYYDKGIY
ncbi:MAG: hypothetical protein ACOZF2_18510 [Thermodesulfobacteriota bacterium]